MQYLGIDVHAKTSTWCLLDEAGEVKGRGQIETNAMELQRLCLEQGGSGELIGGKEKRPGFLGLGLAIGG